MKHERRIMLNFAILVIATCLAGVAKADDMGTAFTYQGRLYDANSPAEGEYDMEFKLYVGPDVPLLAGSTTVDNVEATDGYFTVQLDFGSDAFPGSARWLQIGVRPGELEDPNTYSELSPRQELTPTPYAMHSKNAETFDGLETSDFAFYFHPHSGSDITSGTVDETYIDPDMATDTELTSGLATKANVSHSHDGVYALISHNHDDRYYTEAELQSSGSSSVHWDNLTSVPAGLADGDDVGLTVETDPTVTASVKDGVSWDELSAIPAGFADDVDNTGDSDWTINGDDMYSAVSGNVGIGTTEPNAALTVAGAILRNGSTMYGTNADTHINLGTTSTTGTNGQDWSYVTVGGGRGNEAIDECATIGGGHYNDAGYRAAVGGGMFNKASGSGSAVGGGYDNAASGYDSTIGGGEANTASSSYATISGGYDNDASAAYATIGGGLYNTVNNDRATIAGGLLNVASGEYSTVGGGEENSAIGQISTVGGGSSNTARGWYATISGGRLNVAGGDYSFAAGHRAKVRTAGASGDDDGDEGTFIWADSTDADFTSTGPNQFLIRASGGVGIGTTGPNYDLDVAGDINFTGGLYQNGSPFVTGDGHSLDAADGSPTDVVYVDNDGNVGIGTTSPAGILDVSHNGSSEDLVVDSVTGNIGIETTPDSSIQLNVVTNDQACGSFINWNDSLGYSYGVRGLAQGSGGANHIGVFGYAFGATNNWAGYFDGRVYADEAVAIGTESPTGIFEVSHDGSSEDLVVDSGDGNIGIGVTPDSSYQLYAKTSADVSCARFENIGSTGYAYGVSGLAQGPGGTNHIGVYGYAMGATNNWAGYFNGRIYADEAIGVGTENPQNELDVEGAVAIGASYSGTESAPSNGLIVQGSVGIGTDSPARILHVSQAMRLEPGSAPAKPSEGDMYMDGGTHKLMVYDGTFWRACW